MEIALGILLGAVVAMSLYAATRFLASPRTVLSDEGQAMQAALHAASATLPHLRRGLSLQTAQKAAPHLRALTQAELLAIADGDMLLAVEGPRGARFRPGEPVETLFGPGPDDRVHVEPRIDLRELGIGAAVVAPLVVRGGRIGSLAAFYASERRIRPEDPHRAGGRDPGFGSGRTRVDLRAGGAPGPGRAQRAASTDLAPLRLQRPLGRGQPHPLAARRGASC